jgi:phosphatidylethanolamine-binding protein (PEBP) family uncharacterized protein
MAPGSPRRGGGLRARTPVARGAVAGLIAAAAALAGCGGAGGAAVSASAGPRPLLLTSPEVSQGRSLPAQFTCAGRDTWPSFTWGEIPAGTAELVLFLLDLGHTQRVGGALQAKLTVGWSVRGLSPTLHGMVAGRLPRGATAGHGRYSICPSRGGTGEYMFRLYALPSRLPVQPQLSDLEVFRKVNQASSAAGDLLSSYTRS